MTSREEKKKRDVNKNFNKPVTVVHFDELIRRKLVFNAGIVQGGVEHYNGER